MTYKAPLVNHHADHSICPKEHKHTVTGKPLHPACPGRAYSSATCSCGEWEFECSGKGYVNEERKRHLARHSKQTPAGPKVLRDRLRLDTA
ncbi:hypothetical protein AB0K51_01865 [Kitasatospora sp. NPDC049285]|uniref:hypothetical protein n=1 Tax=Kitasatospora sp. NPDC049285 TaxID=3157096 RepID=UPI00343BEBD2